MTILLVWPLFLAWSFTSFQAPICPPSGWIWAQIAKGAMYTPGAWGVRDGKAAWGDDVIPFRNCRGQSLG
ncbi:hypothetical protein GQ53DRAFT_750864 [Thozetella sp. PMI_491]|nr:hypothetical protein GQ53DRAFT_750864 [Thozetella sp. PMI_491]